MVGKPLIAAQQEASFHPESFAPITEMILALNTFTRSMALVSLEAEGNSLT